MRSEVCVRVCGGGVTLTQMCVFLSSHWTQIELSHLESENIIHNSDMSVSKCTEEELWVCFGVTFKSNVCLKNDLT